VKRAVVNVIVGAHRALFTMATAMLGVAGSLVAQEPCNSAHWFLLGGSGLLMYVEDECGDIHQASQALTGGKKARSVGAQIDVFETHNTRLLYALLAAALAALVTGFAIIAF
jgi:hypothetical protein